jgi:hypothetical protein
MTDIGIQRTRANMPRRTLPAGGMRTAAAFVVVLADSVALEVVVEVDLRVVVEVVLRWVAVDRLVEEVIEAEVNSMDIVSHYFLNVVGEKQNAVSEASFY